MSGLTPLKKVVIRAQASEVLLKYIMDNNLSTGEKLPSERNLAEMLSIGRNTLRESLRKLETIGVLEVVNGRGIFVKDATSRSLSLQIETARVDFMELLGIRRVLESHVIDQVIANASNDDITNIGIRLARLETACAQGTDPEAFDTSLHHAIYKASHNHTLNDLVHPLAATFHELWKPLGRNDMIFSDTLHLHRELFSAIRSHDADSAKTAMIKILDMDEARVVTRMTKNSGTSPEH